MTTAQLHDIPNYLPISPTLGTAGQPTPEQFVAVAAAGYTTVINLALSTSDNAIPNEAALVASLGMTHFHIPVVWEAPTQGDLDIFLRVMALNEGRQVFVHCAKNMRVSAFVYLYRVLHQGVEESIARVDLHRIWQPNPTWQAFIDRALPHPLPPPPSLP
jgi:protein tyrosine phosphatase (PTP) superfamily phosphohydrolase (DUF442 family)